jgi:hypothetical protein
MTRAYDFPDDSIQSMTSAQLRKLIKARLPDALDQCDGTDPHTDIRAEYAQDIIEQAVDRLHALGEDLSDEEKSRITFIDWRTTEQKEADAAREDEEIAFRAHSFNVWADKINGEVAWALLGVPPEGIENLQVSIDFFTYKKLPVATLASLMTKIAETTGTTIVCGDMLHDPRWQEAYESASFSLSFSFTTDERFCLAIARLAVDGYITDSFEVWDFRPESINEDGLARFYDFAFPPNLIANAKAIKPFSDGRWG